MTDIVHATQPDGLFLRDALCGADAGVAGNLWLTDLPRCVTCAVCRDLIEHRPEETPA